MSFYKCFIFLFLFCFFSCQSKENLTKIQVQDDSIKINRIPIGSVIDTFFSIKNVGLTNLRIVNVAATCECSVVFYDSLPITPGKIGKVHVKYSNLKDTDSVRKIFILEANTKERLHPLYLFIQ